MKRIPKVKANKAGKNWIQFTNGFVVYFPKEYKLADRITISWEVNKELEVSKVSVALP